VAVSADGLACLDLAGAVTGKGDVLIFKPGINDANGYGHSIIDFLSDTGSPFAWATQFNVLEVGPEGNNGATYQTGNTGFYPNASGTDPAFERMTYDIVSDGCLSANPANCVNSNVPEPGILLLTALAMTGLGISRRRAKTNQASNC
jgi:hypothetical protein